MRKKGKGDWEREKGRGEEGREGKAASWLSVEEGVVGGGREMDAPVHWPK